MFMLLLGADADVVLLGHAIQCCYFIATQRLNVDQCSPSARLSIALSLSFDAIRARVELQ